jgi:hypothetical protein
MRRLIASDRTEPECRRRGRPEVSPGNGSRNAASMPRAASIVSSDDASPDAVNDLLTDELAGFVSPDPAVTVSIDGPTDVRETVERLIRSIGS